jgi:dihydroorotate dehydrogenase
MGFFISPPFGNYIEFPNTISIKGSFTLYPRSGLIGQIIRTLRYNMINQGWVNSIGLRNKGIDYAIEKYKNKKCIVSIAILNNEEISILIDKIPNNMNIELNVSCPNTKNKLVEKGLKGFLNPEREWCIIKLSPLSDKELIDSYYKEGFRQFHCSNTLPSIKGGISGKRLMPYNKKLITYIKNNYQDSIIIAGGGIDNVNDINYYKNLGADNFSFSTVFFNLFKASKLLLYINKDNF